MRRRVGEGMGARRCLGKTRPHRQGRSTVTGDSEHAAAVRVAGAVVTRKQVRTHASEWMGARGVASKRMRAHGGWSWGRTAARDGE
jgi:hypothetical protein